MAKDIREQKLKEAQDIAEAVLDAEVRIRQLMSQALKATKGTGVNQYTKKAEIDTAVQFSKSAENRTAAKFSKDFKNRTAAKFEKPDPSKIDPELVFGDRLKDEEDDDADWDDIFTEETAEEPPAEEEPVEIDD